AHQAHERLLRYQARDDEHDAQLENGTDARRDDRPILMRGAPRRVVFPGAHARSTASSRGVQARHGPESAAGAKRPSAAVEPGMIASRSVLTRPRRRKQS